MAANPTETPQEFIHVPCSACGSEMVFDPVSQGLLCNHCGNRRELPRANDLVQEQSLLDASNLASQKTGFDIPTKTFHCNNCGANTAVEPDQVDFHCPFCDSTNVNEGAFAEKMIRPFGILPFRLDHKKATEKFRQWIGKGGLFRPGKLKRLAQLEQIKGVYLPFWTYDAYTQSRWAADAGEYYYTTETYRDKDGNTRTRQVRHTRWYPVSGYHERAFDDVLVTASVGLNQGELHRINPFELQDVANYDSRFILGYEAEVYQQDVEEGFKMADDIMDGTIRSEVIARIPGDTYRSLRINTRKSNLTFKHLLLPVWIAAYQFNNKTFRFVVNGQTGKVSGKKPLSKIKVAIAVIIAAIIIAAIAFASGGG